MDNKKTITGLELKWEVLLVYLFPILGFIFSFIKKNGVSNDAKFHYKQSGSIFIIYVGVTTLLSIFGTIQATLVFSGNLLALLFGIINFTLAGIDTVLLVFAIITVIKSFTNQRFEIPVINNIGNLIWK